MCASNATSGIGGRDLRALGGSESARPRYRPAAGIELVTSALTVTEVLVHPLRLGRADLADQYRAILLGDSALRLVHLDAEVAIRAAELRARYNLRTPDAVQLASALVAGAEAFLTNDSDLSRVAEIRVVQLRELIVG